MIVPIKFVVGRKVDMDSCGTGLILGVNTDSLVEAKNIASPEDLSSGNIACIECGGTGQIDLNNWDHHDPNGPQESAIKQVARVYHLLPEKTPKMESEFVDQLSRTEVLRGMDILPTNNFGTMNGRINRRLDSLIGLIRYIDLIDTKGPQSLRETARKTPKITLSDVFSGMLFSIRDPVEQFRVGVEILRKVVKLEIDSFGEMPKLPEWQRYIAAKQENDRQIAEAVKSAQWETTASGKKLGYLETLFIGAPGALYNSGAEIVVAFNPLFGQPPVKKFTVAGNGTRVNTVLPKLNSLEAGWGGPATGTIVGSPREGSKLSMDQVIQIVKETL